MNDLTRRRAIGLGVVTAALTGTGASAATLANDGAVRFRLKDVLLVALDEKAKTLDLAWGSNDHPVQIKGVPVAGDVQMRVSHVLPGVVNNLPFAWERVKPWVNKRISVMFLVTEDRLEVSSLASAND